MGPRESDILESPWTSQNFPELPPRSSPWQLPGTSLTVDFKSNPCRGSLEVCQTSPKVPCSYMPKSHFNRGQKINSNFFVQSFSTTLRVMDVRAENRGRPHQKLRFPAAPAEGRNVLTPAGNPDQKVYVYAVFSSLIQIAIKSGALELAERSAKSQPSRFYQEPLNGPCLNGLFSTLSII